MSAPAPIASQSRKTAFLVMRSSGDSVLCPFFSKCNGVLVFDPDSGSREFHANTDHSAETMCNVILKTGVHRLVLGFIAEPAARKLQAGGVDMRLGSCARPVEELAMCFDALPHAASPAEH